MLRGVALLLATAAPLASAVARDLDAENFQKIVFRPSYSYAFVKFYAPW